MRHQHAGLAVPDFPLAYGKLWPPMDAGSIERANQTRLGVQQFKPITAFQIGLHMAHRIGALFILILVGTVAWRARREQGRGSPVITLAWMWAGLICLQAALGAATVWSNKAADVATLHVLIGAASLVLGAVLCVGVLGAAKARPTQQSEFRRPGRLPNAASIAQPDPSAS
jgi:cytochrome c oxidase assembly protein subunit 15